MFVRSHQEIFEILLSVYDYLVGFVIPVSCCSVVCMLCGYSSFFIMDMHVALTLPSAMYSHIGPLTI